MASPDDSQPPKRSTKTGRKIAWLAIALFLVWTAASIKVGFENANAGRTRQVAVVEDVYQLRIGVLYSCDVTVLRADGVREQIHLEHACRDEPANGDQVRIWVSDNPRSSSYLDGDQGNAPTDLVMAAVFMIGIPFLLVLLPAVFYLRRPRADPA